MDPVRPVLRPFTFSSLPDRTFGILRYVLISISVTPCEVYVCVEGRGLIRFDAPTGFLKTSRVHLTELHNVCITNEARGTTSAQLATNRISS